MLRNALALTIKNLVASRKSRAKSLGRSLAMVIVEFGIEQNILAGPKRVGRKCFEIAEAFDIGTKIRVPHLQARTLTQSFGSSSQMIGDNGRTPRKRLIAIGRLHGQQTVNMLT